jgi:hypothetical protein
MIAGAAIEQARIWLAVAVGWRLNGKKAEAIRGFRHRVRPAAGRSCASQSASPANSASNAHASSCRSPSWI